MTIHRLHISGLHNDCQSSINDLHASNQWPRRVSHLPSIVLPLSAILCSCLSETGILDHATTVSASCGCFGWCFGVQRAAWTCGEALSGGVGTLSKYRRRQLRTRERNHSVLREITTSYRAGAFARFDLGRQARRWRLSAKACVWHQRSGHDLNDWTCPVYPVVNQKRATAYC